MSDTKTTDHADREKTLSDEARLDRMLANLQRYIDQRAAEVAQPLIAEAREAAMVAVERAQHEKQRAEDLTDELRRQLKALDRENQTARQGRDAANTAIARVRQLHAEIPHKPGTCYCANPYPCPTIRALDGLPLNGTSS